MTAPRRRPAAKPAQVSAEFRAAAHKALDDLLDRGACVLLIHAEIAGDIFSRSVPQSAALAEGIARRVFRAWFSSETPPRK